MRRYLACLLVVAACGGDDGPAGVWDDLEPERVIAADGLGAPVDMVRDRFGIPHLRAQTVADLAYAQGYVMAADRVLQMDLFRHVASGTVAELYGALDPGQIAADLEMRIHRTRPLAAQTWAELQASDAPDDIEIVVYLERFADGVNAYLDELRAGEASLDPAARVWFDPERAAPWTPVDSLVIGRLQAMNLSYVDDEIYESAVLDAALTHFDPAAEDAQRARRAGAYADLRRLAPIDPTATVLEEDAPARAAVASRRPRLPPGLLAALQGSRAALPALTQRLRDRRNGSNNWVAGPALTGGGAVLANDPHLALLSPSIFYLMHLTVDAPGAEALDVAGITFPGIPGIILGHNQHLAWGATTAYHDVTDFYLEDVAPCSTGGGDCVSFRGEEIALETWTEEIRIGALGTITDTRTVTYERVPHHGPLLPLIEGGEIVPRSPGPAVSVRYTGHEVTHELRAFHGLWRARSVEDALASLERFGFGAQNFVIAGADGRIAWTTHALVPLRSNGCFTFDPVVAPDGVAPWLVLPADGSCEWEGWMDAADIPRAVDPEAGFLATANADPVGATFDGDPFDGPRAGAHVRYLGARDYAEGVRVGRITRRLRALAAAGAPADADAMAAIQGDTYSGYGSLMTPHLLVAIDALEAELAAPGTRADLEVWAAELTPADIAALRAARALLAAWRFETPAAVDDAPDAATLTDSAATVLFNVWVTFALPALFADEAAPIDLWIGSNLANAAHAVLSAPQTLVTGVDPTTDEAVLCDDARTQAIESCTRQLLVALLAAMDWTRAELGADSGQWRWGELHRVTLTAPIPATELNVPPPGDADPRLAGGYPRPGDNFSVDASAPGMGDRDFRYGHGPAMRHITVLDGDGPRTRMALPGGQVFDRASPHFRDLMDEYWSVNRYFDVPWTVESIRAAAETRWRFE